MQLGLEAAVGEPLLQVGLVLLGVGGAEVGLADEEAAHQDVLGEKLEQVLNTVALLRRAVVSLDLSKKVELDHVEAYGEIRTKKNTYHSTNNHAAVLLHGIQRGLKVLASDVLEVDVDALGREALERIGRLLRLVVEAAVEAELLGDEVELVVGADGADDAEPLVLGDLADDLADGAGGAADEDGLAALGLADLVQGGVGGQAGHAEGAEEEARLEAVGVVELLGRGDLVDALDGGVQVDLDVLLEGAEGLDQVADGVVGRVRLEHARDGVVDEGLAQLKGGRVRLGVGLAHAAPQVRVIRRVQHLGRDAALGRGCVCVEADVLNGQVLARDGEALGHLLEDQGLVDDHGGGLVMLFRDVGSISGVGFERGAREF